LYNREEVSGDAQVILTGPLSPLGPSVEETVRQVNSLSPEEFANRFLTESSLGFTPSDHKSVRSYEISFYPVATLPDDAFKACFSLIEETSLADYKAAKQGWQPDFKRDEMREPRMRYLFVQGVDKVENASNEKRQPTRFEGFLSFMVDTEEAPPNHSIVSVIYIYEMHLKPPARSCGLGRHLMTLVEDIGHKIGINKTMLTVFASNTTAESFYRRMGYKEDPISPFAKRLRNGTIKKPEYYILSKSMSEIDI
jgi:N-alpha-acetyltransferase 40